MKLLEHNLFFLLKLKPEFVIITETKIDINPTINGQYVMF